jgi:predicted hotdog family 3-hydroxylacyl-ACP dehydratase
MPESVLGYLPHRPPMVLIDELVEAGDDYAVSRLMVKENTPFMTPQGLPAWAGIELMAQTISLFAGVRGKKHGLPPKVGFLLGTRRYESSCNFFPLHSELIIRATELYFGDTKLGVFECSIECAVGQATAKLNVYEPTDLQQILKEQHA